MEDLMHPVITKTFGGLSGSYYFRQFIFGLVFPLFIYNLTSRGGQPLHLPMVLMMVVSALLYPYSRFVYESVVGFIVGENVFFVNAILLLAVKAASMLFCWMGAILIAPLGLAYLYYHHSKPQR
jgi:F0F1-type ATP synthase assembly protein I